MKKSVVRPWMMGLSFAAVLSGCVSQQEPQQQDPVPTPVARHAYVSFPALGTPAPLQVAGRLSFPTNAQGKVPAVVIAHGSAGVDTRGSFHAQALHAAGIATLELDMWSARGLAGGAEGRPRAVAETLPDAWGALKYLSAHPSIDGTRIGIMGFSWGGLMSMLSATRRYVAGAESGQRFAAHAPFYPVCWAYNRVPSYEFGDLTGAPVFIQAGAADQYDDPDSCQKLVDSLAPADRESVSLTVYPGATHGWDRLEPAVQISDPYSHTGQGGQVNIAPSPETAETSRRAMVDFFRRSFGLAP
ncbi:dienelactone hydrolase family protein [Archangium lansingense]|uniref:Dienelactone hydrolase family protein n=1 Tax=Archangium lansingense TaxID=2995310 RepID=A0ABT3ZZU0_9BACT|nr:dienelactone hydrolase family protein [Archangium lansinium]MCY1074926.1 dienelactone hydrolase family protein [Archangium lansinium]